MNPITKALDEGYSSEQILSFLSHAYPVLGKKIKKARDIGYSIDNILNFLSGTMGRRELPEGMTQQEVHAEKRREDIQKNLNLLKGVATTAATLGGGYLAGRALQNVAPNVGNVLARSGLGQTPGQVASAPITEAMAGVEKALSPAAFKTLRNELDLLNLTPKIEKLVAGNAPEALGGLLQKQVSPEQKQQLEAKFGKPFSEIIKDYANQYLQKAESAPFSRESLTQQINEQEAKREEKPKEEKGKLVALPDGRVGTLLEERQGIGSVQLPSGEVRRRQISEMDVELPELEKQITDLISAIPEDERSAVLAFASYTPDAEFELGGKKHKGSFMGVQFHNGDFYMYPDVSKEQFDKVVKKTVKAKTSGENPWHAWTAGKKSRGAGMYELLQELREEFGDNFIKFKANEGYDYFKRIREIVKKIERERKRKRNV